MPRPDPETIEYGELERQFDSRPATSGGDGAFVTGPYNSAAEANFAILNRLIR